MIPRARVWIGLFVGLLAGCVIGPKPEDPNPTTADTGVDGAIGPMLDAAIDDTRSADAASDTGSASDLGPADEAGDAPTDAPADGASDALGDTLGDALDAPADATEGG
ncbi:MAG: hypothetical protein IPJ34_30955 [Myxococcales bacterium]|nr:hypothetical protein [Myxococcales bacterium]